MWSDITLPPINLYNAPRSLFLSRQDPFKTSLAKNVFKQKYALHQSQSWYEKARDIVNDVCGVTDAFKYPLMSKEDRDQLVQYIYELKFLPGGRYIYYAGRKARYWNNCASGDTKLLTDKGWVRFDEVVGDTVNILSPVDGSYKPATMHYHGTQDVYEYTFTPLRGRSKIEFKVKFTEDHKWPLTNGSWTENLSIGDVVPANTFSLDRDDVGFAHGFVFGDGNINGQLRLCSEKDIKHLERLSNVATTVSYPKFSNGDPCLYFKQGRGKWKELPETSNPEYIASFIMGWLAADGSGGRILNSVNKKAIEYFRKYAAYAGLVISGELREQVRDVKIGDYEYKNHRIYVQNYSSGSSWGGFKVSNKEFVGHIDVYCPFEPEYNRIVIDHGIDTFNCYLFKSQEDTKEDWAEIVHNAMLCLSCGGGIGNDYSVYRPKGRVLSKTGGLASGPIPLMFAINEIGRQVQQGGSRRSAIYASLNWQHEDAKDFLTVKNWDTMPITRDYSFWDAKMDNFNFPCPLDMTNISLNYDNAFLNKIGDYHEYNGEFTFQVNNSKPLPGTFIKNVEQALRTGEPGFSFNFGDKENETARNACTEVTSSDTNDVCNLGSINIGNIESLEEFTDVVRLASMFLVNGTIRAELPYQKVYDIREKNRRLGLGLMGMHEWLLKRGYKYEVVPELHKWLEVYRDESERSADTHCSRFYLSKPVAYRAIAPTGTIGILAGYLVASSAQQCA